MKKVSIQGIKGAFHEEAAWNYFGNKTEIIPQLTFSSLVNSVQEGTADYGVMAVENTISGTIHANLNLIRQSTLKITGEVFLRIKQNLAVLPGTDFNNIKQVQSHYMAINQCRKFFQGFPEIELIDAEDTALSMQIIAENELKNVGVIGSQLAADLYGLQILAESIETNKKNYTRFLILEKEDKNPIQKFDKASLAMMLPHEQGSLAKILSIIAFYNIDLSKIESVPVIGEPWHYLFYLDVLFENSEDYFNMLNAVRPLVDELTIMGEYPSGKQSFNQIHKS